MHEQTTWKETRARLDSSKRKEQKKGSKDVNSSLMRENGKNVLIQIDAIFCHVTKRSSSSTSFSRFSLRPPGIGLQINTGPPLRRPPPPLLPPPLPPPPLAACQPASLKTSGPCNHKHSPSTPLQKPSWLIFASPLSTFVPLPHSSWKRHERESD